MHWMTRWKHTATTLKCDITALALALSDSRTPWYARAVLVVVVAYALSPIDLIPDFIPVLGQFDDLLLLPLGVALVIRLLPPDVLAHCRHRARMNAIAPLLWRRGGAVAIISCWLILAGGLLWWWIAWAG
jgi:uncharacterized membrane protein YkvA (DUF1232 family)